MSSKSVVSQFKYLSEPHVHQFNVNIKMTSLILGAKAIITLFDIISA
jgi:hypothetical protein